MIHLTRQFRTQKDHLLLSKEELLWENLLNFSSVVATEQQKQFLQQPQECRRTSWRLSCLISDIFPMTTLVLKEKHCIGNLTYIIELKNICELQ